MTDMLKEDDFKPDILQPISLDNEMKKWLVNYVGEKLQPQKEWQENLQQQLDKRGITLQIDNENRLY